VQAHPLRREIAATQMTNIVVDLLGMTFVHRMIRDTGATPVEITRAALIAMEVLAVEGLLERLEALGRSVPADVVYDVLDEEVRAVEGLVRWILLNDLSSEPVEAFADVYRAPLAALRAGLPELLPGAERRRYKRAVKGFVAAGMPEALAIEAASFQYLPSSLGVIEVARSTVIPLEEAARHFFALGERLSLGWLRDRLAEVRGADRWETIAVGGLVMDLREAQRDLTERFVRARALDERLGVASFVGRYPNVLRRFDEAIAELREDGEVNLAAGGVLVRLLEQMREG
jgi:glutamate dehydrogenase